MVDVKGPNSRFIKVACEKCKNDQIMFSNSASEIKCLVCQETLAKPTGGKSVIKGRVIETLS